MKRKKDSPAAVRYTPSVADACPVIQNPCVEAPGVDYAIVSFVPRISNHNPLFGRLVDYKWRTGEYHVPDGCESFMMKTTAILYPCVSDDHKAQQTERHNYDNFINTMAEMIQKYAPQIQRLREGLR